MMDKRLFPNFRTYLIALSGILAFPLTVQDAIASDLEGLLPGHWYEVPNSKLRAVVPNPAPEGNVENVIRAWSGGAFDTRRDRLLVWGGGHADYSGNEIYAFDLDTLTWERLTDPSMDVGGNAESGTYPDGLPRSRHTYDYLEYLPDQDLFCSFSGAALYPSGNVSTLRTDCYDFQSSQWIRKATIPSLGGSKTDSVSAFDHTSGMFYYKNKFTSSVGRYDPAADSWEELGGTDFYLPGKRTAEIDSKNRVMVIVGEGQTAFFYLDTQLYEDVSISGSGPADRAPGLAYDLVSEQIVAWDGGANVYSLDVQSKTWRTHTPASTNTVVPPDQSSWGTFGRFRYVPSKNLFVVVSSIDQNVFVYRLSPGSGMVGPKAPTDLATD